jgi:hypothetical protein
MIILSVLYYINDYYNSNIALNLRFSINKYVYYSLHYTLSELIIVKFHSFSLLIEMLKDKFSLIIIIKLNL